MRMGLSEALSSYARGLGRTLSRSEIQWPLVTFLGVRLLLSIVGAALFLIGLVPTTADAVERPYFGVSPVVDGVAGVVLGVWQRFDVIHYMRIASGGYSAADLAAFPPLYPLLARLISTLAGGDVLAGAFVVSNLSCLLLLTVLHRLVVEDGFGLDVARRALVYLLLFPTAFFLMVPYSESLFLLLSLVTFREARRGRWVGAGLAGLAASLTRTAGFCLAAVLAVELLRHSQCHLRRIKGRILVALSPLLGLISNMVWQAWRGFPSTLELQWRYWHRLPVYPWQGVVLTVERIAAGEAFLVEHFDLAITLLILALGVVGVRRLPMSYSVYFWTSLAFNLWQVRIGQPLSGQARFCIVLFPAFITMAMLVRSSWGNRLVVYPCLALLLYLAGQFVLWGWVG